jgi:anti-sigma factor RsiW
MSTCHLLARIGAYYDGEIGAEERRRIEAHLASCPVCRQELAGLRALSERLASATGPKLARDVIGRIQGRIEGELNRSLLRTARTLLALAACLFLAFTVWAWQVGPVAARPAAAWETVAVSPQAEPAVASDNPQLATATWIVQDLRPGGRDAQ